MPEMARSRVDFPEPDGPVSSVDSCAARRSVASLTMTRPSGRRTVTASRPICSPAPGRGGRRRQPCGGMRRLDRGIERGETIEHGLEVGERDVIVHEEGQGFVDAAEGARGLRHHAEGDLAGEVERRRDDIGNDRAQLSVGRGEADQIFADGDDLEIIADDRGEALPQRVLFRILALEQRDLLGVFAQPRQREAEVGLIALPREGKLNQRASDEMRDPGADAGVDQRDPEQEAREGDRRIGQGEVGREHPQQNREGHQRTQIRNEQDREGVDAIAFLAAVDEAVDVLGDALVGVVGAAAERHAVMGVAVEPAADVILGQPAPPADDEGRGDDEFENRRGDIDESPGR